MDEERDRRLASEADRLYMKASNLLDRGQREMARQERIVGEDIRSLLAEREAQARRIAELEQIITRQEGVVAKCEEHERDHAAAVDDCPHDEKTWTCCGACHCVALEARKQAEARVAEAEKKHAVCVSEIDYLKGQLSKAEAENAALRSEVERAHDAKRKAEESELRTAAEMDEARAEWDRLRGILRGVARVLVSRDGLPCYCDNYEERYRRGGGIAAHSTKCLQARAALAEPVRASGESQPAEERHKVREIVAWLWARYSNHIIGRPPHMCVTVSEYREDRPAEYYVRDILRGAEPVNRQPEPKEELGLSGNILVIPKEEKP